jgi:hypothetical protein
MGIWNPILARRPKTRALTGPELDVLREAVRQVQAQPIDSRDGTSARRLILAIIATSVFWAAVAAGLVWWLSAVIC